MSPLPPADHYVFVDFENAPEVDLAAIQGLPVYVTLLIGKTQTKLSTSLVVQIHAQAAQVRLVRFGASGRNALDLTLAYYLGRAVAECGPVEFHIVSKDKDFEPLMAHLRTKQVRVARAESFGALHFLAGRKPVAAPKKTSAAAAKASPPVNDLVGNRIASVVKRLSSPTSASRPSTEQRLRAHVKTGLGKQYSERAEQDVFMRLQKQGILTIEMDGKITYHGLPVAGSRALVP